MTMAKRADTGSTTKTTLAGNRKAMAYLAVMLPLFSLASFFGWGTVMTAAQQRGQFANQLSTMQNNNQKLALYYLANVQNYHVPANQSWSVQFTDQNPASSTPIGQFTISWNGQSRSLLIQNGIVDTGISPAYAATLPHAEFMTFSQAVITRNAGAALFYYSVYHFSGKLKYTRIG